MNLKTMVLNSSSELEAIGKSWEELLSASDSNRITNTWLWHKTWWEVFGEEGELLIVVASDGENPIAILPLWRKRVKRFGLMPRVQIRMTATGEKEEDETCSDHLDVIIRRGYESVAVRVLFDALEQEKWDEFIIDSIDSHSRTIPLMVGAANAKGWRIEIDREIASFHLDLPASWDEFLSGLSSNFRWQVRRKRKELADAVFNRVKTHEELDRAFNDLIELHQRRWQSVGKPGAFASSKFTQFHRLLSHRMLDEGHLYIATLSLGRETIAVNYCFLYESTMYFYQSGTRLFESNKISPGIVMNSICIEDAIKHGATRYDLMRGDEQYKLRWKPTETRMLRGKISRR